MQRVAIATLVLASILLGALAAGTPVNGNDTVAATTAGIEIGASVHSAPRVVSSTVGTLLDRQVLQLTLALVLVAVAIARVSHVSQLTADPSLLWGRSRARRGPPARR